MQDLTNEFLNENSLQGGKLLKLNFSDLKPWSVREYTQDFIFFSMILFSVAVSVYVLTVLPAYPLRVPQSLIKSIKLKSKQITDSTYSKKVIPANNNLYPVKVFIIVDIVNKTVPLDLTTLTINWTGGSFSEELLSSAIFTTAPTFVENTKYSYFYTSDLNAIDTTLVSRIDYKQEYFLNVETASTQTDFDGEIRISFTFNYIKV